MPGKWCWGLVEHLSSSLLGCPQATWVSSECGSWLRPEMVKGETSRTFITWPQISHWTILDTHWGFPNGSVVKNTLTNAGDTGSIPGSGRSPGEGNGTWSSTPAWKILWTEKSGGLQSMGSQRVGQTEQLSIHAHMSTWFVWEANTRVWTLSGERPWQQPHHWDGRLREFAISQYRQSSDDGVAAKGCAGWWMLLAQRWRALLPPVGNQHLWLFASGENPGEQWVSDRNSQTVQRRHSVSILYPATRKEIRNHIPGCGPKWDKLPWCVPFLQHLCPFAHQKTCLYVSQRDGKQGTFSVNFYFFPSWMFIETGQCLTCILIPSSVQFSHSVMSDSLWPHWLQHARPPCPSPTPGVYPNSCPLSRWCHAIISSSVVPFSSCPQSFPASGSFQMSQLFALGGQSIGVSASTSVLLMSTQEWSPLRWSVWISLQSKGLSRVFANTTVQKHLSALSFLYSLILKSICDYWKNHSLD